MQKSQNVVDFKNLVVFIYILYIIHVVESLSKILTTLYSELLV